jgi:hypothetical protein
MANLLEILGAPAVRPAVIQECATLIDQEVASKGGVSGMVIKGGYKIVKSFKPGFVPDAVDGLLDDFCKNLQPLVDEAHTKNQPVDAFFNANKSRVADALLAITDARAQRSKLASIKSAYEKLRPMAKKNVEEAVPRLGALVQRHGA